MIILLYQMQSLNRFFIWSTQNGLSIKAILFIKKWNKWPVVTTKSKLSIWFHSSRNAIYGVTRLFVLIKILWCTILNHTEIPATFSKPLTDRNVKVKETLVMECELTRPNVQVNWQKDGQNITSDDRVQVTFNNCSHTLKICHVATNDGGTYTCVCGSENTECKVTVEGKLHSSNTHVIYNTCVMCTTCMIYIMFANKTVWLRVYVLEHQ